MSRAQFATIALLLIVLIGVGVAVLLKPRITPNDPTRVVVQNTTTTVSSVEGIDSAEEMGEGEEGGDGFVAAMGPAVLFQEGTYGFTIATTPLCEQQFAVVKETPKPGQKMRLQVLVPGSVNWKMPWFEYAVMSRDTWLAIPDNQPPGRPALEITLDPQTVLVKYEPQHSPTDIPPQCLVSIAALHY